MLKPLNLMAFYNLTKIKPNIFHIHRCIRYNSHFLKKMEYKKCYQILGISEDSDQEQIRRAYLMLVKKYHPDSNEGNTVKFQEVNTAFRTLTDKKSRERWQTEDLGVDVEEQDIKHTAPQHRQYLSYGGVGSGTPFQRQKQYTKVRAMQAAENLLQHRIQKVTAEENALMNKVPLKHKIKTKYGYERLVEDLIQEAMSKGQFDNLAGSGKPLDNQNRNPYVDFVTHKLNEILIENGFTPEWITLQKEIRQELDVLREGLSMERKYFGKYPLSHTETDSWDEAKSKFEKVAASLNKKINKFNLVVPVLNKQMLLVNLDKEAQRILINGKCEVDRNLETVKVKREGSALDQSTNLFGFLDVFFRK